MQNETLLTQTQVADYLQLDPRSLENYRYRGIGPKYLKVSRRCVRYRLKDVQDWLREREIIARAAD